MFGNFAVIVWESPNGFGNLPGNVYLWCESLATALNTATDLMRNGTYFHAVAVKII